MKERDTFWSKKAGSRPRIYAHRGGGEAAAFENTISAFLGTVEAGADGVEIDVRSTADGELICFHDDDLKRISGSRQKVRNLPFRTLRSIPLEGNERVPTLAEAFAAIPPSLAIILDVKTSGFVDAAMIEKLLRFLKMASYEEKRPITVTSFNYISLWRLARSLPELRVGIILQPDSIHSQIAMASPFSQYYRAVHPQKSLVSEKQVEVWHKMGLDVIPWTVNDREEAVKLANCGVDGIITDHPALLLDALK